VDASRVAASHSFGLAASFLAGLSLKTGCASASFCYFLFFALGPVSRISAGRENRKVVLS
jgi:hypothetical protein